MSEQHLQFGETLERIREELVEVKVGLSELVRRVDRQNGRVDRSERDIETLKGKAIAVETSSVFRTKMEDSDHDWRNSVDQAIRDYQCVACDPKWRTSLEGKVDKLTDWKARLQGSWITIGIISLVLMNGWQILKPLLAPHVGK